MIDLQDLTIKNIKIVVVKEEIPVDKLEEIHIPVLGHHHLHKALVLEHVWNAQNYEEIQPSFKSKHAHYLHIKKNCELPLKSLTNIQ